MIQIAFLWHMHQPLYLDPATGTSVLPWVRMHATRAYYDMVKLAADYPGVHTTFNLVPVLMSQLQALCDGRRDKFRDLAEKHADALTETDARFLIDQFFQADWGTLVYPNPGYRRLLELRGGEHIREDATARFMVQDLRDLQVWFNLAWFGFSAYRDYPELQNLRERQRGFTEADKRVVFEVQDDIIAQILPLYARAQQAGFIEISATPFYHPILPLLCDTDAAARALPNLILPRPPFQHPQDARAQIERAVEYHRQFFGKAPQGMWPSEGSVSPEIVPLLAGAGLNWFATSEGILHHSSLDDHSVQPPRDYHGHPSVLMPYQVGEMAAFFRHLELSDLIGFTYSRMPGREAAYDLLNRIRRVADGFRGPGGRPPIVPIILDGENPWEHYRDGGESFLRHLYQGIHEAPDLMGVTFSEHLEHYPPATRIRQLWSGSWIGSTYGIWIGHPEDVAGWERLEEARAFLTRAEAADPPHAPEALESARESLYAAEGSDWFWWYGDEFSSQSDHEFDRLFRAHLTGVYERLGAKPPGNLAIPIKGMRRFHRLPPPRAVVRPIIDGQRTTYIEWTDAGEVPLQASGGAMARGSQVLRRLVYGFDERGIYLRLDFGAELPDGPGNLLDILITGPTPISLRVPLHLPDPTTIHATLLAPNPPDGAIVDAIQAHAMLPQHGGRTTEGESLPEPVYAAIGEIIEISLPRSLVKLETGGLLEFFLKIEAGHEDKVRYPAREIFQLEVPSWDSMTDYWQN